MQEVSSLKRKKVDTTWIMVYPELEGRGLVALPPSTTGDGMDRVVCESWVVLLMGKVEWGWSCWTMAHCWLPDDWQA